jgi:glycosyltransferase involved in cell wall biosynthesis
MSLSTPGDGFGVHSVFPNYYDGTRVSYSLKSIVEAMEAPGVRTHTYVLGKGKGIRDGVHALLPAALYRFSSRLVARPAESIVRRFLGRMEARDVVYFWLANPPALTRSLQQRKLLVVREMINCTLARRREALADAARSLGRADDSGISDADIALERDDLRAADAVFCPNDHVLESVLAYGVPPERCLRTSYGWSPARISGDSRLLAKAAGFNLLFAGTADIRKGFPWLLQAWARAGVPGRLLIAGHIDAELQRDHAALLQRPDVVALGYVADIGAAYLSADAFCFPTWEEGGPMVTIEAMGAGLPCIVTPMGAAGILSERSGGGLLVPPGDVEAIAAAIRRLAHDDALRSAAGQRARELAAEYTWQHVGRRRREAIIDLRDRVHPLRA